MVNTWVWRLCVAQLLSGAAITQTGSADILFFRILRPVSCLTASGAVLASLEASGLV